VNKSIDNLSNLASAHTTVEKLRGQVCRLSVAEDNRGVIGIWKGRGQQQEGCGNSVVEPSDPQLKVAGLTEKSKQDVRKGIELPGLPQARDKVNQLRDEAAQCARRPTSLPGCPQPSKK
jgi:hypothetical protein